MRISLIGPVFPYRGGIAHSHTKLAQALAQAGHTINVISFKRQYPAWLYPGKSDRDPSQDGMHVNASFLLDPLYPWTWEQAVREITAFKPDIVIIQWWTVFWAPALAWICHQLKHHGLKTTFFIHNVIPHEPRLVDPWLARLALNQADTYITLTEREHQRLKALIPSLVKPVFTSPLPIYQFSAETTLSKAEARARLNLPENDPILLFFGLVRPYKGLFYLMEAFGQLVTHPSKPYLVIAGEFWENPEIYIDQIRNLGIENRVRIENRYLPDEEAVLWFMAADIFIAPYTGGTQSAALRLALGYGLPVIATEVITRELTGLEPSALTIVPAADSHTLSQAIQDWLENPFRPSITYSDDKEWAHLVNTIELTNQAANGLS